MTQVDVDIRLKTYRSQPDEPPLPAIRDLRLALSMGEFVCLVGPSGCGKTTLLNIVAGLDRDFQGRVTVAGGRQRQPVVGYVFQNPRLLPWRTVRENIELALPSDSVADVDALLRALELDAVQQVYPQRLSLGMSRRVALARAFATQPDLLLMDEPFVSLDAPTARRARQLLLDVWTVRPHGVLFVTHDLPEAIALADRLVFLSARPSRVIAEVTVDIARDRRDREGEIEAFRRRLTDRNPAIGHLL